MLVLSRKVGERIRIGDNIFVTVVKVQGDKVRLGFEAPADISIMRTELDQAAPSPAPPAAPPMSQKSPA